MRSKMQNKTRHNNWHAGIVNPSTKQQLFMALSLSEKTFFVALSRQEMQRYLCQKCSNVSVKNKCFSWHYPRWKHSNKWLQNTHFWCLKSHWKCSDDSLKNNRFCCFLISNSGLQFGSRLLQFSSPLFSLVEYCL